MEATPATLLKTAGDAVDAVLEFAESRRRELLPVSVVLFAVGFYADYADIVRPGVAFVPVCMGGAVLALAAPASIDACRKTCRYASFGTVATFAASLVVENTLGAGPLWAMLVALAFGGVVVMAGSAWSTLVGEVTDRVTTAAKRVV